MNNFKKVFSKNNIKSGTKIIAFILVFVILLQVLSAFVFSKINALTYRNAYTRAYAFLTEPDNTIEIAGIGSSDLYSAFVPMQLYEEYGYTSTVISSPHQTVLKSYGFLNELLKTQHPKVLIIETDMFYEGAVRREKDKEADKDKIKKTKIKLSKFFDNFSPKQFEDLVESQFSIFTFHDKWKKMKIGDIITGKSNEHFVTIDHGYNFNGSVKPADENTEMKFTDKVDPMPEESIHYINKMLDICEKENIKVIFVEMPSQRWTYSRHNAVQAFADDNNIEFIDFNTMFDEINLDIKCDYRDGGDHLNYYGATKITSYLSDYIKNNYSDILTDRRNDSNYSFWADSNKEFKKKYNV